MNSNDKPLAYSTVPNDGEINPNIAAQFDTPEKLDRAFDKMIDRVVAPVDPQAIRRAYYTNGISAICRIMRGGRHG